MELDVLELDVSLDVLGQGPPVQERVDGGHVVDEEEDLCARASRHAEHLHQGWGYAEIGWSCHHAEKYLEAFVYSI